MHVAAYTTLGLPYSYRAIRVPSGQLGNALTHLQALGYQGVNITVPLKEEACQLGIGCDTFSVQVGAVNTIDLAKSRSTNTDGPGFIETLHDLGCPPSSRVLLLGAGGSARSLAFALFDAGYELTIWNRTESKAKQLAEAVNPLVKVSCTLETKEADIVINATSVGLTTNDLSIDWDQGNRRVAVDLVYGKETAFLRQARKMGWRTEDGYALLVAQGALAFEYWLGIPAPRKVMSESISGN